MRVLVKSKGALTQNEYEGVTNIALTNGNYVLTLSGGTVTFSTASYNIYILVQEDNQCLINILTRIFMSSIWTGF